MRASTRTGTIVDARQPGEPGGFFGLTRAGAFAALVA
jgi:hypothetical protein